jgi:hypothetical protein
MPCLLSFSAVQIINQMNVDINCHITNSLMTILILYYLLRLGLVIYLFPSDCTKSLYIYIYILVFFKFTTFPANIILDVLTAADINCAAE